MPFTIYVKVIFVSLLFYFVDNIIDLKNWMKKKPNKIKQNHAVGKVHNPNIAKKSQNIYISLTNKYMTIHSPRNRHFQ